MYESKWRVRGCGWAKASERRASGLLVRCGDRLQPAETLASKLSSVLRGDMAGWQVMGGEGRGRGWILPTGSAA